MNKKNPKASADEEVDRGLVIKGEGWDGVEGQRGPQGVPSFLQAGGQRWGSQGPPGWQLATGEGPPQGLVWGVGVDSKASRGWVLEEGDTLPWGSLRTQPQKEVNHTKGARRQQGEPNATF